MIKAVYFDANSVWSNVYIKDNNMYYENTDNLVALHDDEMQCESDYHNQNCGCRLYNFKIFVQKLCRPDHTSFFDDDLNFIKLPDDPFNIEDIIYDIIKVCRYPKNLPNDYEYYNQNNNNNNQNYDGYQNENENENEDEDEYE